MLLVWLTSRGCVGCKSVNECTGHSVTREYDAGLLPRFPIVCVV